MKLVFLERFPHFPRSGVIISTLRSPGKELVSMKVLSEVYDVLTAPTYKFSGLSSNFIWEFLNETS